MEGINDYIQHTYIGNGGGGDGGGEKGGGRG